jgi:hypothetical protein
MGSSQSHRIESSPKEVTCPCETSDASGQENNEIYEAFESEEETSSSDEEEDEWFEERLIILQDSRQLRQRAG